MPGSIKTYTPNFRMIIPEFNVATWHDYIEENFRSIDALFHNLFGINGFSGIWKTNSQYTDGQVLFVGEDNGSQYEGRLIKVIQDTNTSGFATFSDAIRRYPNHYEMYADASSAEIFATLAQDWATKTGSTIKTPTGEDTGEYSAKHHAQVAAQHEEACEMYKNLAKTDSDLAKESENEATTQAQIATTEATNAATSATNAKTSETNAKTSEQNALVSEQNAKSSEDNAKVYETNAANSVETQTNNFNTYNNQLLSTTSAGVSEINNAKTSGIVELDNKTSNALSEINSKTNVLDKTMITNCITEIPQDIKLELNNGTLALKAGSVLYEPSGVGNFIKHTTTQDYTWAWGSGQFIIIAQKSGNMEQTTLLSKAYSGTAAPSNSSAGDVWYDTTNNIIKRYHSTDGWVAANFCLPIAIVTSANNTVTSIDQIFNGFGYISSTVFALPGVKGLIPNGRNEDGTLKNTTVSIDSVQTITQTGPYKRFLRILANKTLVSTTSVVEYNEEKNENVIGTTKQTLVDCGTCEWDASNKIISLQPKTTFHAVDYFDFKRLDDEAVKTTGDKDIGGNKNFTGALTRNGKNVLTENNKQTISDWSFPSGSKVVNLTLGATGTTYTAPANGWFIMSKRSNSEAVQYIQIACGGMYNIQVSERTSQREVCCILQVGRGQIMKCNYTVGGETLHFKFVYAQGEK